MINSWPACMQNRISWAKTLVTGQHCHLIFISTDTHACQSVSSISETGQLHSSLTNYVGDIAPISFWILHTNIYHSKNNHTNWCNDNSLLTHCSYVMEIAPVLYMHSKSHVANSNSYYIASYVTMHLYYIMHHFKSHISVTKIHFTFSKKF